MILGELTLLLCKFESAITEGAGYREVAPHAVADDQRTRSLDALALKSDVASRAESGKPRTLETLRRWWRALHSHAVGIVVVCEVQGEPGPAEHAARVANVSHEQLVASDHCCARCRTGVTQVSGDVNLCPIDHHNLSNNTVCDSYVKAKRDSGRIF